MKIQTRVLASLAIVGSVLGTIGYVQAQAAGRSGDFRLQRVDPPAAANETAAAPAPSTMTAAPDMPAPRADRN